MSAPERPTVQLLHVLPDDTSHIDWMLSPDPEGREPLVTFRSPERIDRLPAGATRPLVRIGDHRPAYLTYEGPVSGGRGAVSRVARGHVTLWTREDDRWVLIVAWDSGARQQLTVASDKGDTWTVRAEKYEKMAGTNPST